nr:MAG TPA: hypothetical protein [Bacteriophage sp.]
MEEIYSWRLQYQMWIQTILRHLRFLSLRIHRRQWEVLSLTTRDTI